MTQFNLPECHFLGPYDEDDPPDPLGLPKDWSGDPFEYLPKTYTLTDEELELAAKYERSDISGGYIRSQVAHFRKPKSAQRHSERKARLATIIAATESQGLALPESFLKLTQTNDYIDRIRHNLIWLRLYPILVPFPHAPEYKLVEIFYEGQGCGYWALLLGPDRSHCVVFYGDSLNTESSYPHGHAPDYSDFSFYRCAASFDQWLAYYFLDCHNSDQTYENLLKQFPGM